MRHRAVDMDTVARQLGISKTTVHRALTNSGRISAETRERVLKAAQELGYRPNRLASGLRGQRTGTIGVLVVGIQGSLYSHILEGLEEAAQARGDSILLACSGGSPEQERKKIELLLEKQVDGILFAPADPEVNSDYFRGLAAEGIPMVCIDRGLPGVDLDVVMTDNELGGYLAVRHLLELGRRKIAFLTAISRDRRATSVIGRYAGCNRALAEAGLPPAAVIGLNTPDSGSLELYACNAVHAQLKEGPEIDAIFTVNDGTAFGTLRALKEARIRIPDEIAVVGFDDQDVSAFINPGLTTIRQPMQKIGLEALNLLYFRISEQESRLPPRELRLEPQLIVRGSSVNPDETGIA